MIINIYPTNTIPPVSTIGTHNDISNLEFFEALLSAGNENTQQTIVPKPSASSSAHETGPLRDNALLNLSPQALNYLNGIETTGNIAFQTGDTPTEEITASLTLAPTSQQKLSTIVAEFNNAPLDENTLTQIQGALLNAGINPQQVSLQEVLQFLATPAYTLQSSETESVEAELNSELLAA